ncbi:SRPBCC family protein [Rhodococcus koreensis]
MQPTVSHIDIDRPPAQVFGYATDPSRFAEWQHDVVGVLIQGDRPLGVGSRFTTTRRVARLEFSYTQEITALDPPRSWAARGVDGMLRPSATITVEPLEDGTGSRATFTLAFQGKGVGKLVPDTVRRMAAKQAPKSYQRLKERLEHGNRPSAGPQSNASDDQAG